MTQKPVKIEMTAVTIRQKGSVNHTKFILRRPSMKPFPMENFKLAEKWMEEGLLADNTALFVRKLQKHLKENA
jgi:hypothetical protein